MNGSISDITISVVLLDMSMPILDGQSYQAERLRKC